MKTHLKLVAAAALLATANGAYAATAAGTQITNQATATYNDLKTQGLDITYPLTDEPYGQRRFGFSEPSGLWVDIVEQIEPAAGYWDKYMLP